MSSARPTASRHVSRVVLAVVSALILVATVVGAGVTVVMGQLQGNITAVDISEQLGSAPPASFPVVGAGFGHGVGMSQWGAYGMAKALPARVSLPMSTMFSGS